MTLFELVAKLVLDTNEYNADVEKSKKIIEGFGDGMKKVGKLAAAAFGAAEVAVAAFAKSSVDTGMKFDSAMSQVAATMGTTVDQIGELRDYAQKMGQTTAFSASEAADAMNILAMAGYNTKDIISTLPAVLNMAAAGGLGIAQAADYATGIIAGFSNETLDASVIADKLAVVASSAKGDVASFGEGLSTVAGMANTTGQSMQDMTVALGILGNNNFAASEAGNALSRTLKNLYQPTDSARKAMAKLGVSAYDAEGKARPLQDVLIDLNSAVGDMDDKTKNATLSNIFDAATLKSVPALLNNATGAWDELAEKIGNSEGAAKDMANVQLDNLQGDVTLFKSALEGAQIAVSDGLTPSLRDFVQFGTRAITGMTQAFQRNGISGAFDTFSRYIDVGLGKLLEGVPKYIETGMQLVTAVASGFVKAIPSIANAAVEVAQTVYNYFMENFPMFVESGIELLRSFGEGLVEGVPELLENALPMLLDFVEMIRENFGLIVDAGLELIVNFATGIINALPILIEYVPQIVTSVARMINDNMPKIIATAFKLLVQFGVGLIQNIPVLIANVGNIVTAIIQVISAFNWISLGTKVLTLIANGFKSLIMLPVNIFRNLGQSIITTFQNGFSWSSLGSNIISGIVNGIKSAGGAIKNALMDIAKGAFNAVKSFFGISSPSKLMRDAIGKFIPEGVAVGINANADSVYNAVGDLSRKTMDAFDFGTAEASYSNSQYTNLASEISSLKGAILGMNVVLDTGAMVGGLSDGIDRQLGLNATRRARGI